VFHSLEEILGPAKREARARWLAATGREFDPVPFLGTKPPQYAERAKVSAVELAAVLKNVSAFAGAVRRATRPADRDHQTHALLVFVESYLPFLIDGPFDTHGAPTVLRTLFPFGPPPRGRPADERLSSRRWLILLLADPLGYGRDFGLAKPAPPRIISAASLLLDNKVHVGPAEWKRGLTVSQLLGKEAAAVRAEFSRQKATLRVQQRRLELQRSRQGRRNAKPS
jgi:hypothetical protein